MSKIALVAGSTGLIGELLAQKLIQNESFEKVILISRSQNSRIDGKVQYINLDFESLEGSLKDLSCTHVFCALGTTIKKAGSKEAFKKVDHDYVLSLAQYVLKQGAVYFGMVTSMGASASSSFFYNQVKGEIEDNVKALGINSVGIFQPSLLLGNRKESRFGEAAGKAFFELFSWVFVGSLKAYRAIHASKVADAMVKDALEASKGIRIISNEKML